MNNVAWKQEESTTKKGLLIPCYKAVDMEVEAFFLHKEIITGFEKEDMVGTHAPLRNNTGIYFLIGDAPNGYKYIYVGIASERIEEDGKRLLGLDRIKEHIINKDWYFNRWDTCIFITNINNTMDLGLVAELERIFIRVAKYGSGHNVISLNKRPGTFANIPKSRYINTLNAILSLLNEEKVGVKFVNVSNINAPEDVINNEVLENIIINSYETEVDDTDKDDSTNTEYSIDKFSAYDNMLDDLNSAGAFEYKGRIYDKSTYTSYKSIYGKKSEIVVTSLSTVQDMIDEIPKYKFSSNSKFLCLASKDGKFPRKLIEILMSDDKSLPINSEEEFKDKNKRMQHILNNMIYVVCESAELTKFTCSSIIDCVRSFDCVTNPKGSIKDMIVETPKVKCLFNLRNRIKERGVLCTKNDILKEFGLYSDNETMKFDAVLSNPPYNNGADLDFVNLAFEMSKEHVIMIVPGKWQNADENQRVASKMSYGEFRRKFVPHMRKVCYYPDSYDLFDIKEIDGITYFALDKKNIYSEVEVENRCKLRPEVNSIEKRPLNNGETLWNIGNSIIKKMGNYKRLTIHNTHGRYAVNINSQASPGGGGFLTKELNENGKWVTKEGVVGEGGLLLNSKSKNIKVVGRIDIIDTQNNWDLAKASGTSSMVFRSDNIDECYSFKSYIECKDTRFKILIGMSKLIIMNNSALKFVDDPGKFDHKFTDAELYSKYNYTKDEIEFIEAIIK